MRTLAISGVLLTAIFFGVLFAIGGAGMYGSPLFGSGNPFGEKAVYALAILVGPLASLLALVYCRRLPQRAGVLLLFGAMWGVFLGLLVESHFRYVWGKVFAICVWLPMAVIGARLFLAKPGL